MGFKIKKQHDTPGDTGTTEQVQTTVAPPTAAQTAAAPPPGSTPSWMKTGADADAAFEQQSANKAEFGNALDKRKQLPWEFFMKPGEEKRITFLDGHLSTDPAEQGRLLYSAFRFHTVRNVKFPNKWDTYVCLADEPDGCPLCEAGDESTWVAVFPIIDHTPFKKQDGSTVQHEIKLFVAKSITMKLLQKKAAKLGGLAYQTFDMSRTDAKMARVGDQMEHVGEAPLEALVKKFPQHGLPLGPDWYLKSVPYFTREEILAMGYGAQAPGQPGVGPLGNTTTPPPMGDTAIGANVPMDDDLPF